MPRQMTDTERAMRHEQIIRDSFRSQQQSIHDWVRLLIALGEPPEEIARLVRDLSSFVTHVHIDIEANRYIPR